MVKINGSLKREIRSTIKTNFKRYLSLVLIIFLGSAFYVGMKVNTDILQNSMIKYFDKYNYADMKIASEIGLTDTELNKLKKAVASIEIIEGKYYVDTVATLHDKWANKDVNKVFAVNSYSEDDKLNQLNLLQGRLLKSDDECVADASIVGLGYELGDKIKLESDVIGSKEYTIVGFARNPQYISVNRGSTTLLDGRINYFIYIHKDNFKVDGNAYMLADIKLHSKYKAFTENYNNYLANVKKEIIKESASIASAREKKIIAEKTKELDEAEAEYNVKKAEVEGQLNAAEDQLTSAETQLAVAESKVMSDKEVELYLNTLKISLESSKAQITSLKNTVDIAKSLFNDASNISVDPIGVDLSSLKEKLTKLQNAAGFLERELRALRVKLEEQQEKCEKIETPELKNACNIISDNIQSEIRQKEIKYETIQNEIKQIKKIMDYIENYGGTADVSKYKVYINELESSYNLAITKYNEAEKEYNNARKNLKGQMAAARNTIATKKTELQKAREEFESKKKEALDELEKAYNQIIDAKKLLGSIEGLSWHVFTRNDSTGYSNYYDDTLRIDSLARILPLIFFIVAILVTATSITRMVQEERRKIGILKSLGYSSGQVTYKYLYYTFTANIIGSILGIAFGLIFFPMLIYRVYSLQYFIPDLIYKFNFMHIIFALVMSFISTVVVAAIAVKSVLKEKPSELMRNKKIKSGRTTALEKKHIWKKLPFTEKVTYRNIFLSVGRSIMTIVGITGCTALIIASYGIRESIKDIVTRQFNNIYNVSAEFFYKPNLTQYEIESDFNKVSELSYIKHASLNRMETTEVKINNKSHSIYTIIPNDVSNFEIDYNLYSVVYHKKIDLSSVDGIVLSEKLSKLLNAKIGDNVTFVDSSNISHTARVGDIAENYVFHHIFMTKQTYKQIYGYESQNNVVFTKYDDESKASSISEKIYKSDNYASFLSFINTRYEAEDLISRFDIVIYVVIISAGLLAFVVLYNLAKINISERTTEVATLKVMGYNSKQINKYINHEISTLTFIGIIIGIFVGYILTNVTITICEVDSIMFYHGISYVSYVYGILLTIVFSKVINIFVRQDLKKISMTESFESIE